MLKILQARLQQYINHELPDVQAGFRKGRGTRDQIVNICCCESWTIKKAECRRIDAFELRCWRRLLSPLDCKEIQPVHSKGDQSWVFIGRTDVEAETPILWPPGAKS